MLPNRLDDTQRVIAQRELVDALVGEYAERSLALWYYTPMGRPFTRHLRPVLTVYDCMDELANFKDPPAGTHPLRSGIVRGGRPGVHRRTQSL